MTFYLIKFYFPIKNSINQKYFKKMVFDIKYKKTKYV